MGRFADTGDSTTTDTASKTVRATQIALPSRRHWVRFLKLLCVKKCLRRTSECQSPTVGLRVFAVSRRSWRPNCKPDFAVRTKLLIKQRGSPPPLSHACVCSGSHGRRRDGEVVETQARVLACWGARIEEFSSLLLSFLAFPPFLPFYLREERSGDSLEGLIP